MVALHLWQKLLHRWVVICELSLIVNLTGLRCLQRGEGIMGGCAIPYSLTCKAECVAGRKSKLEETVRHPGNSASRPVHCFPGVTRRAGSCTLHSLLLWCVCLCGWRLWTQIFTSMSQTIFLQIVGVRQFVLATLLWLLAPLFTLDYYWTYRSGITIFSPRDYNKSKQ